MEVGIRVTITVKVRIRVIIIIKFRIRVRITVRVGVRIGVGIRVGDRIRVRVGESWHRNHNQRWAVEKQMARAGSKSYWSWHKENVLFMKVLGSSKMGIKTLKFDQHSIALLLRKKIIFPFLFLK